MTTQQKRPPGIKCPKCGRFLGDPTRVTSGEAEYVCCGLKLTVGPQTSDG